MFNRITILILLLCTLPLCAIAGTIQLPKTGQTTSYAAGDDGDLKRGVAWPEQRFSDHGNGAVTDSLTGLMWTKNANLMASRDPGFDTYAQYGYVTWQRALDYVRKLNNERYLGYTDWRLPNRKELGSLVDYSQYNPALPGGHPFTNVQANNSWYWSSSTYAYLPNFASIVDMWGGGVVGGCYKFGSNYVWPVRAGQSGSLGNFAVSAPASATAGTAFNFTVTALDQFNNTATDYSGTIHFTSSDTAAVLPTDATLTNGVGTFSATLKTTGSWTITATDTVTALITGASGNITVNTASATHFTVSAPASTTHGEAFNYTVTALDQFNNTATDYSGTVHFTSSDTTAVLPADATLTSGVGTWRP